MKDLILALVTNQLSAEDRGEDGRYSDEYFARADQIR